MEEDEKMDGDKEVPGNEEDEEEQQPPAPTYQADVKRRTTT